MLFWKEIPFFRLFIFFTSGLLLAHHYCCSDFVLPAFVLLIVLLFFFRRNNLIASSVCVISLILAGLYVGRKKVPESFSAQNLSRIKEINATVIEVFNSGKGIARINLEVKGDVWLETISYVFVRDSLGLSAGETFFAKADFENVSELPESGWKEFLKKKNVSASVSMSEIRFVSISEQLSDRYRYYCFGIKRRIHNYLLSTIPGKDEAGLVLSLLMGGTTHLDKELKTDFRDSGVMHIIAVSGMHLSLLFLVVAEIIFFIKRNRKIDLSTLLISLSFIWAYAAITGFSSSVLRAAVMFTVMLFSTRSRRGYHSWNSFFLSAFILLFLFPDMLYDLGFHLSYLAVAGIFLVQPVMRRIRFDPVGWRRNVLSALVMSLAAQAMVSPYLIYLFGTFSPAFLIANLIMVPLSSAAVYAGIIHLIVAVIPFLSMLTGYINYYLAWLLIWFSKLFSWVIWLRVDLLECFALYVIMGLTLIFVFYKNRKSLVLATVCSVMVCFYHLMRA